MGYMYMYEISRVRLRRDLVVQCDYTAISNLIRASDWFILVPIRTCYQLAADKMKFNLSVVVMVAAAVVPTGQTWAETRYDVTWLGFAPNIGAQLAINDKGQVSGGGRFLWQSGMLINLGELSGRSSEARDINDHVQVVGRSGGNDARPYIWKAETGWVALGNLPNPRPGYIIRQNYIPFAINDRGQVIAHANFLPVVPTYVHAYLYNAGSWTGLGDLPNAFDGPVFETWANDLNELGEVVGFSSVADQELERKTQAMLWRDGQVRQLPALPGTVNCNAIAINESSVVVGQSGVIEVFPGSRAGVRPTLWLDAVPQELALLAGDNSGSPTSINDSNQVVGQSYFVGGPNDASSRAALWEHGDIYDLNSISVLSPSTSLRSAHDINNSGQIVGTGIGPSGRGEAFLLTPIGLEDAPAGTLDLGEQMLVAHNAGDSSVASVRRQIITGRGGPGMGVLWQGTGITSSAVVAANANDPESRSVGYAENSALPLGAYTTFRGRPVDDTSILMAFTRTADANLDGVVNDDDVTIVSASYAPGVPQPSWALGDFDYNGFVDDDDVTLLGVFYNPSAPPIAAPGASVSAVPEPRTVAIMFAGLIGILLSKFVRKHSRLR
jgi:uncharacterized membrane protein